MRLNAARSLSPVFPQLVDFINIASDFSGCPEVAERLRNRDASLWSDEPGVRRDIESRLGWLDPGIFMDRHSRRITDFTDQVRAEGYQQVVLLGMGGSSLAPEVFASLFGDRPRSIPLTVVDTTSPQHVRDITARCERAATLFIVSSKSGTTAETTALEAHFFEWARSKFDQPGRHFAAVTDPGSPLQSLASERGYRDTFENPADIGGRFSALSFFGLVPASLSGADLAALRAHLPDATSEPAFMLDACRLGTVLGDLARQGRNKLTLRLSAGLSPAAAWIEQLIDESTGKDGRGIVAIPGESVRDPGSYSEDRVFVIVDQPDEPVDDNRVDRLAALGHPVAHWRVDDVSRIGAEFLRWEAAAVFAGGVLGINPFDEPDVDDSKAMTRTILDEPGNARETPPQPWPKLAEVLDRTRTGDYLAVLAYLPPGPEIREQLDELSDRLGRRTGLPCCPAFGPRYLHSSGQLHKGGPDQGIFIVITPDSDIDVPIPGQRHGFRSLIRAQALGDIQVLTDRGRRVVHLEVGDNTGGLAGLVRSLT